ncbi:Anaerobic dimethyl sulfoxide reductase chain B [Candidatus Rhodobacter oscarellae]|uniref:Anaerobic dimethyl sulfoxide reductase chain B n=1 Tax=Candidatus Rhodobacter oscarellae TaxID=1675527 RepID=A0A0J9E655_9RHOB|nr:4Fe-4S dicluster domain-containing protein [Candidatus Rhodobacter lobularis]KMW58121.1 Anaerobic dimethyl sulfoxide reductase chain B [Candidatus Rhodobacter lobularis]
MTDLPTSTARKLGLVIDLDTCVGCHACVVACKGWNTENYGAPLADKDAYGAEPVGSFLNRIHSYEVQPANAPAQLIHFPKSCLHCEGAPCVTVCPTGASYKRVEDGIVLVNESDCIGCGLCAWACPYGAREMDPVENVMKKCTLCVDRIYNENLPEIDREPACVRTCPAGARHFGDFADPESNVSQLVAERGGIELMPEQETKPVNRYLPPRPKDEWAKDAEIDVLAPLLAPVAEEPKGLLGWLDKALERL